MYNLFRIIYFKYIASRMIINLNVYQFSNSKLDLGIQRHGVLHYRLREIKVLNNAKNEDEKHNKKVSVEANKMNKK